MMLTGRFSALLTLLAVSTGVANAAISANCTLETVALSNNDNLTEAYLGMEQQSVDSIEACLKSSSTTSCPITVDTTVYEQTCTDEGGQIVTPTLDFSCKNDNTGIQSTMTYVSYGCVGSSCGDADNMERANTALKNYTDTVNKLLKPANIECAAEFSSGASQVFASAASMMMGGMMMLALLW